MNIVGVKFQNKFNQSEFLGREYSYFVADNIELKEGDIVPVTTKNGAGMAMVTRTNIQESEINEQVMPFMRTLDKPPIVPEIVVSAENDFFEEELNGITNL